MMEKPSDTVQKVIRECGFELATNFEAPAARIISFHANRVGVTAKRFEVMLREIGTPTGDLQ